MPEHREGLNLGPGPKPTTAAQWEERLAAFARAAAASVDRHGTSERIRVSVQTHQDGELAQVELDLTGVRADDGADDGDEHEILGAPPPGPGEPATIDVVTVRAHPFHLRDLPVDLHLQVRQVQVRYLHDEEGNLWIVEPPEEDKESLHGQARVAVGQEDLQSFATTAASTELERQGLRLETLDIDLATPGRRQLVLHARVKIRKGILSAPAELRLDASIDDSMVATIGQLQARSSNPLVGVLLGLVRGKLERYTGRRYDLNDHAPSWLRLVDVEIRSGEQVELQARFA